MASDSKLETTIDKILVQSEDEVYSSLKSTFDESLQTLAKSESKFEQEYDRIVDEGKKEAEKIEKQIVGSSDLESRNKQLKLVAESVQKVFDKAVEQIKSANRDANYSKLIETLLSEATDTLGTKEVNISTNSKDKEIVNSLLSKFPGSQLSSDTIDCLGGVVVASKDGSMSFNNTIDARLDRMKPLIRKEIATKFGIKS
ncbi:MAG TPA: V-type ATP synthase subunit E [Nitrosopumilaceae archaeon]|nr:V-type ATP synthase subunit E [Nitrosopumilaceae archaeon]